MSEAKTYPMGAPTLIIQQEDDSNLLQIMASDWSVWEYSYRNGDWQMVRKGRPGLQPRDETFSIPARMLYELAYGVVENLTIRQADRTVTFKLLDKALPEGEYHATLEVRRAV